MATGVAAQAVFGLFSGMFIGLFAVSLAENIKALPIFVRRVRIGAGLGIVVLAIGLGKAAGHLLYYLKLYPVYRIQNERKCSGHHKYIRACSVDV